MKRIILPRYFFFSVLLLLILVSLYVFSEAQRQQRELLHLTEAKGAALAEAMETNVKNAILGNSLLEDLISQRLLDNARLIDQLLLSQPADQKLLEKISAMNRLQKIDLLDLKGRPLQPPSPSPFQKRMEEMMARKKMMERMLESEGVELFQQHQQVMIFMWGRRWSLPGDKTGPPAQSPPRVAERKFWEGSVFGVAIGARSFSGIIAVHANADYILNFRKEIEVQKQIEELGRQSDIEHVALLDQNLKILAHTDPSLINQQENDAFMLKVKANGNPLSRIVQSSNGDRHYDVVKPVTLNQSALGYLEIGLSLNPMEVAWRKSLSSMFALGLAILAVGILGMATIFYNQQSQLQKIKSLEAEVSRQERLSVLGNMAATVAHEIRNPLNSISMGLQRLKAEFAPTQDEDQYARFIELMQGEVQRLNSIVEQFLSLARPLEIKPEELRIQDVLKELATLSEGDARQSKVRIQVMASPDLPPLRLDRNYLKQLLLNLILNGVQAMPQGGTLTLEAKTSRSNFFITVTDTGVGIPLENLSRIFEPYFTTKTNGSGLGLAIARRIVEAHGGTITVSSEPDRGCRFQISLPMDRVAA